MKNFNIGFQNAATPIMEGIIDLHNYIFFYLILIFVFVFWVFLSIIYDFYWKVRNPKTLADLLTLRTAMFEIKDVTHASLLEVIWTITPSFILVLIAVPSFALLYAMDEVLAPLVTLKPLDTNGIGHMNFLILLNLKI